MAELDKPTHVKPALYAHYYYMLKEVAKRFGYNLLLHGSLNRDLDFVAVPWQEKLKPHEQMVKLFAKKLGGEILKTNAKPPQFTKMHKGRINYIINIRRFDPKLKRDMEYYLDISVIVFED